MSPSHSHPSLSLPLLLLTSLLSVIPVLASSSPGVKILRAPESRVAPNGDEIVFECETSLAPDLFEWRYRRHQNSSSRSLAFRMRYSKVVGGKLHNITNANAVSKLSVFVRHDTQGEYRCVAWFGPVAVTSTTARLDLATIELNEPDTSTEPIYWRATSGNTLLLPCGKINSKPAPAWSFYRNGVEVKAPTTANNDTLVLSPASETDSGLYSCAATNTVLGLKLALPQRIKLEIVSAGGASQIAPHFLSHHLMHKAVTAHEGDPEVLLLCPSVGMPKPTSVWSSPNAGSALHTNRTRVLPYGLQIFNVEAQDAGIYICYIDNGVRPTLEFFIELTVQQLPRIVRAPSANLTNEGEQLHLECRATGDPEPQIYWLLNGENIALDSEARVQSNGKLILNSVQKRHAGYIQCFARNELGEHSAGTLLQVNPKQIQSEPTRHNHGGGHQRTQERLHRKQMIMVPPSAPNVTRLSDECVMLRWHVRRNDGLPIQFFKVQYRMLKDSGKRNWETMNDDIAYGKPKWNNEQGKSFTASVPNLKPQHFYRFRIMAVYSNNDNKESMKSSKFFLQRGAALKPLPVPELVQIEEHSQTAVVLHWRLASDADEQLISGYYAYYRPSSSAGEYYKATIEGAQSRSFQINTLEPGSIYEFKLQSFSAMSASEFSALKQGRTQRPKTTTTEQPNDYPVDTTTPSQFEAFSIDPLFLGSVGGGAILLLLLLAICLCLYRRRRSNELNKARIGELREDFVALGTCAPNKARPRHIHITLNPLAQHEDKSSPTTQDNELGFFQRQPVYDSEPHGFNGHARLTSSSSLRRSQRTLERAGAGGSGVGAGSNNNNLNQAVDSSLVSSDTTRLQTPNKSARVMIKRARLPSRSENLSSGSLNSVGV
ncbi:interference hedgehog [Scaptodrosophila lebanonensis]|uniref:Interference hedgehog n=1 Tax=Drosophila lebanonensis TaxID=7225 RepID=A0A6J2TJV0_DROLE|nr:interference hedgehog [Scaptodrosophila lebanonensis]